MKIKIVEKGWAGYNGLFGQTEFVDGVSTDHVNLAQANMLGGIIRIVEVDDNGNELGQVSLSADMVRTADFGAPVVKARARGTDAPVADEETPDAVVIPGDDFDALAAAQAAEDAGGDVDDKPVEPTRVYTRAELEEIADQDGIKGLRDIGTPLGAKNTSIHKLIDEILAAQSKAQ